MSDWQLFTEAGAQGQSFYWGGVYAPLAVYAVDTVVRYGNAAYIASRTGVLGQPDITPADWQPFALGGMNGNALLSSGNVGAGFTGPASLSSGTPSYVDVSGCAVAPDVDTPITLQLRGVISLATTQAAATNYRIYLQIVDDLGNVIGSAPLRRAIQSTLPQFVDFAADIDASPDSILRTYKLQCSMNDATGGTIVFGGTAFGGAGNPFRLNAVAR